MKKKIYLAAAGVLFAVLLLGAPLAWAGERAGLWHVRDIGNEKTAVSHYEGTPLDGALNALAGIKGSLSDLYTNYMPNYYGTVLAWGRVRDALNAPTAALYRAAKASAARPAPETAPPDPGTPQTESPPYDPDRVASVYSTLLAENQYNRVYQIDVTFEDGEEASFLDAVVNLSDDEKAARVRAQAAEVNRLADANPNVNFYLLLPMRLQEAEYFGDLVAGEESTYQYMEEFLSLLSGNVTAEVWDVGSVRDRMERIYLTDHHWNAYGSYLAFRQICGMIRPEHTPVELGTPIDFPKSRFYGSYARTGMTPDLWDVFRVYDYDLGPYTCPGWDFESRVASFSAVEYTTMDHSLYEEFFPRMANVRYPENETGRNLMVLSDSYAEILVQLLGSAFDKTYYFYNNTYPGMPYNQFIDRYKITDVLLVEFSERMLFNLRNDCFLDQIIVK